MKYCIIQNITIIVIACTLAIQKNASNSGDSGSSIVRHVGSGTAASLTTPV